jgi:hypothetical protein
LTASQAEQRQKGNNDMNTKSQRIEISKINLALSVQVRAGKSQDAVDDYAEAMEAGRELPPIQVVKIGQDLILADGFHRVEAAKKAGLKSVLAQVVIGDKAKALEIALESNRAHGLRMSNEDKHRAVKLALEQWPNDSDNAIAERVGVSQPFVSKLRPQLITVINSTVTGTDGKSYPARSGKLEPQTKTMPDGTVRKLIPVRAANQSNDPKKATLKREKVDKLVDNTGLEIPPETLELWNRGQADEVNELLAQLRAVRSKVNAMQASGDVLYREVETQQVIANLAQCETELKCAIPYAICYKCNGTSPKGCKFCKERGFVHEHFWKVSVPQEIKDLRGGKC